MTRSRQGRRCIQGDGHLTAGSDQHDIGFTIRIGQHVCTACDGVVVGGPCQDGDVLTGQEEGDGAICPDYVAPRCSGLVGVGGPEHRDARHGTKRSGMLHRLVGGSVLAHAHRIVTPDEGRPGGTQGGQANGATHVVAEHQEGPVDREHSTVQGHAVADCAHGVLPDPEVHLSALRAVGALHAVVPDGRTGVAGQVGSATDEAGNDVQERLQAGVAGLPRGHGFAGSPGGETFLPSLHAASSLGRIP